MSEHQSEVLKIGDELIAEASRLEGELKAMVDLRKIDLLLAHAEVARMQAVVEAVRALGIAWSREYGETHPGTLGELGRAIDTACTALEALDRQDQEADG